MSTLLDHLAQYHKGTKYAEDLFLRGPPTDRLARALRLGAEGTPVFPLASFYQQDVPTPLPGLYIEGRWRPAYNNGTRDETIIRAWWKRWPRADIGTVSQMDWTPPKPKNWPRPYPPSTDGRNGWCCARQADAVERGSRFSFCPHERWMNDAKRARRHERYHAPRTLDETMEAPA